MKQRIVILGDSLVEPRKETKYEQTYPFLLKQMFPEWDIINKSRGSNTSTFFAQDDNILSNIIYTQPDVVILHFGIVDCFPHLFTFRERNFISKLPCNVSDFIFDFTHKHRYWFTKHFGRVRVPLDAFESSIHKLLAAVEKIGGDCIIIKIATDNKGVVVRTFGVSDNVSRYNSVLCDTVGSNVNVIDISPSFVDGDGIHLTGNGHEFIANKIKRILN